MQLNSLSEDISLDLLPNDYEMTKVALMPIADGFTSITDIKHDGENLFICDQTGQLYLIDKNRKKLLLDISPELSKLKPMKEGITEKGLHEADERGLLGVAFHPLHSLLYICYSAPIDNNNYNCTTKVSEYRYYNGVLEYTRDIISIPQERYVHNGGRIVFGPKGHLYIPTGDGGIDSEVEDLGNAQNLNSLKGKILCVNVDEELDQENGQYGIPSDNPFIGRSNVRPEIWAYGFRNPWGISFSSTGELFVGNVGESTHEGIFIVKKGGNHGWKIMENGYPFTKDLSLSSNSFVEPIHTYPHSVGRCIIGGYKYRGQNIPELYEKYIFGDWAKKRNEETKNYFPSGKLYYLVRHNNIWSRQMFDIDKGNTFNFFLTSIGEDKDGEIYIGGNRDWKLTNNNGQLFKLMPVA